VRSTIFRLIDKDVVYLVFLVLLFLTAFAVPIFFLLQITSFPDEISVDDDATADSLFPEAVAVNRSGTYLEIRSEEGVLDPSENEDFVFATWFRLKSLPEEGEEVLFVAKFDAAHITRRGYSFGLMRDAGQIVPVVNWRDGTNGGTTHRFSPMEIVPKRWTLLVLSFLDGRYLGMHGGFWLSNKENVSLSLLGGVELNPPIFPKSSTPLYIGALREGRFRGRLGPQMILKGHGLANEFATVLKRLSSQPLSPPETDVADVVMWTIGGSENRGSGKVDIEVFGAGGKARRGNGSDSGGGKKSR
ncbi:MAG: hypothetical protein KDD64_16380, partial [Bdellovibrionales bacterium]|nr:hypothetical protein [Bdellovibrionales bacterium]